MQIAYVDRNSLDRIGQFRVNRQGRYLRGHGVIALSDDKTCSLQLHRPLNGRQPGTLKSGNQVVARVTEISPGVYDAEFEPRFRYPVRALLVDNGEELSVFADRFYLFE